MISPHELLEIAREIAPFELSEEWDNYGLLLDCGRTADKILFALDADEEVIEEATKSGCSIIVSHHPVLMNPQKCFSQRDSLVLAAQGSISVICLHTCWDSAHGGVNDVLCSVLGLRDVKNLDTLARVGYIDEVSCKELAELVEDRLGTKGVRFVDSKKRLRKIAVVGGSAGAFVEKAYENGCDALVTGEIKHSDALLARRLGLCAVAAGHYETENPSVKYLCERFQTALGNTAQCILSTQSKNPFSQL
ncbi:MAG: Nif3-like dinuclear metal center hexameric protein [Oscillospiraceae bacterium]